MTDKNNLPYLLGKAVGFMRIGEAHSNQQKRGDRSLDLINTRISNRLRQGAKRIATILPKLHTYYQSLDRDKAGPVCNEKVLFYLYQVGDELPEKLTRLEQSSFWLGYISSESEYWEEVIRRKAEKEAKEAAKTKANGESAPEIEEGQQLTLGVTSDEI